MVLALPRQVGRPACSRGWVPLTKNACGIVHSNRSIKPCSSRVRGSIEEKSMYSSFVCAPAPPTPSPSSVGIPIATVKLPSDPPPTSGALSRLEPNSLANAGAFVDQGLDPRSRTDGWGGVFARLRRFDAGWGGFRGLDLGSHSPGPGRAEEPRVPPDHPSSGAGF